MNKHTIICLIITCLIGYVVDSYAAVTVSVNPVDSKVLPGSVRSVYSNVQGDANVAVTWSTSGGTLESHTGYTIWTAPNTPGSYTVTATSVVDGSKTAVSTFTVISSAVVKISNIPFQATIYKGQPIIIQSILWGSTDTTVTWSNSGGTLKGTGREVIFTADTAGTYTITSTSNANIAKTATTTIVVTNNSWPEVATANRTLPIDCTATGNGTIYNVTSEATMDAVPWSTLGPGDTVRIAPGTYHKQIIISTSGTESQPIRICGIRDGSGNLPEINGTNATAKANSNFGGYSLQPFGGIVIYDPNYAYFGGAVYPKNIIIEGLKIAGFNSSNNFYDIGTNILTAYNDGVAPIRVQHGMNITIRGNELTDNNNALFMMSGGIESKLTRNLLVEGNYIYNNGKYHDYLEHQSYLQAFGLVVQGNYYGSIRTGMYGGQLKTRSVQQFIRYNYFEPALRIFDLVEVEDAEPLTFPWVGITSGDEGNVTQADVVANYEAYQNKYVYGNIINNVGQLTAAAIIHGSADNDPNMQSGGTLYFYNNTVNMSLLSNETSNYRNFIVDFGPYTTVTNANSSFASALLTNNAVYIASSNASYFFWNRNQADRVNLNKNWVSSIWGNGNLSGGDGTGISNDVSNLAAGWQGGQLATQVNGISNLVTGSIIPFDASSYVPLPGSPLINVSAQLTGLATALPPLMQYSPITYLMSIRDDIADIGAVGVDKIPPVVTVSSPINSVSSGLSGSVVDSSGVASLTLQLAGAPIVANITGNSWSATVPGLVAGNNSLTFVATDNVGNALTTTKTVVVDLTPPSITTFSVPATSSSLTISGISFSASDAVSVTGYLINESDTPPVASAINLPTAPTSYTASSPGTKTLYAWARDAAGNVSAIYTARTCVINLDSIAPSVSSFTVPASSNKLIITGINLVASDNIGVTGYLINESATPPTASAVTLIPAPTSYTVASAGSKTLYAWARDAAGNVAGAPPQTVTVTLAKGDLNGNGSIDLPDILQVLLHVELGETLTSQEKSLADIAPIGTPNSIVDINDVITMLRYSISQ